MYFERKNGKKEHSRWISTDMSTPTEFSNETGAEPRRPMGTWERNGGTVKKQNGGTMSLSEKGS